MPHTTPFPEPESPSLEQYMVYARVEILALLRQLQSERVFVNVYFDAGTGFVVTALLGVNPDFEELVFDCASDPAMHKRLLASHRLVFVAFIESVKLQFVARAAEPVNFEDKPAFRVRMPPQMLRLQRRDFFRVRPPSTKPPTLRIPHPADAKRVESVRVVDISVGGVAILVQKAKLPVATQQRLDNCQLDLPGLGALSVGILVRHVEDATHDEQSLVAGCEFTQLAPQTRVLIQRYVNQVDAEMRKLLGGKRAA